MVDGEVVRDGEGSSSSSEKYGDFSEVKEEEKEKKPVVVKKGGQRKGYQKGRGGGRGRFGNQEQEGPIRVRLPREGELLGTVVQRLGGNKMDIRASDGKSRNSRVPGRFKRKFWLRPGDFVIIKPWESDDSKADIIFQYRGGQIGQLRKRGLLDGLQEEF